jgi:hypothetical protein
MLQLREPIGPDRRGGSPWRGLPYISLHRGASVGRGAALVLSDPASGRTGAPHGDFDEAGVQILRDLEQRYGAVPWRFDCESLREALYGLGWSLPDGDSIVLDEAVQRLTSAVPEELLLDPLVEDLALAASA